MVEDCEEGERGRKQLEVRYEVKKAGVAISEAARQVQQLSEQAAAESEAAGSEHKPKANAKGRTFGQENGKRTSLLKE